MQLQPKNLQKLFYRPLAETSKHFDNSHLSWSCLASTSATSSAPTMASVMTKIKEIFLIRDDLILSVKLLKRNGNDWNGQWYALVWWLLCCIFPENDDAISSEFCNTNHSSLGWKKWQNGSQRMQPCLCMSQNRYGSMDDKANQHRYTNIVRVFQSKLCIHQTM